MKTKLLTLLLGGAIASSAFAQTLLWKDNFNVANNTSFDAAPLTGRLSGTLAANVVARADGTQQQILNNQLRLINNRIRFQVPPNGVRYDWAAGAGAAPILAAGGLQIAFDWVPVNNTDTNWVNVSVGFPLEFTGQRITAADTDYGVLLRNNGGSQRFDNGVAAVGGNFPAILTSRHVEYNYAFSSFADGTTVRSKVTVDGVQVAADTFTWNGNAGTFAWVLETHVNGHSIDNLALSTVPLMFQSALDETVVSSGTPTGGVVGYLSGSTFPFGAEGVTASLVGGAGDTNNAAFQIVGDELQTSGAYDFTADPGGTVYSIRVAATGGTTGGTSQQVYTLTLVEDDDLDDLPDPYEILWATNLTSLNGDGVADFDLDGLTDLEEYQYSLGLYPTLNPTLADTDTDGLSDGEELFPTSLRPPTHPLVIDTDVDGLSDLVESNTFTFVDANDTGTNPINQDTDFDGARDGYELAQATDLLDINDYPGPLGAGIAVVKITAESLTGISTTKTYTHKISGGGAATVNGVVFDALTPALTPVNTVWDTFGNAFSAIAPINNGGWNPGLGNVSGAGLLQLLGGFSYSGNGANAGSSQRFTLSGLTPGEDYVCRFYIRVWDLVGSGRPHNFVFTNGAQVVQPFSALPEDRPGFVTGTGNHNDAYYLEFAYNAEGTELIIDSTVPLGAYGTAGNGTSGSFHMYGLTNEVAGNPDYAIASAGGSFRSGASVGVQVATLAGYSDGVAEASTFALVTGAGDTDNAKFQVVGNQIQVNSSFTGANSSDGQQFFVRVQGTDTATGIRTDDLEVVITVSKDDDLDDLPDPWELTWAGNITDLTGLFFGPGPGAGSGDFDNDGLADLDEYQLSIGTFAGFPTYATINPIVADTDGDGLADGEELFPTTSRFPTSPLLVDTDGDGLSDFAETGTGVFVDANDTGTDGAAADTDGDEVPDGLEVSNGSDPNDPASFLPAAITVVKLTGDATSGIDAAKTYTHLISGGNSATVNGVVFEALTTTVTPLGLDWNVNGSTKNQVLDNLNNWNSTAVGLSGTGLEQLLDSFVYSGGTAGVKQTYTLSGLTMGQTYQFRLYIRKWADNTARPIAFVITNGAQVFNPMLALPEDRPGDVLGNFDNNCAYYIGFEYTADSTSLILDATVPNPADGGFHMYGMSNEVTVPVAGGLKITNVTRSAIGEIVIDFEGAPSTFYDVKKSTTLVGAFSVLTSPLTVMTNGSGIGQAIVPAAEASELAEYYRIEAQ